MHVPGPPLPFHVDDHLWRTALIIGTGFLAVSGVTQFIAGNAVHALADAFAAGVFAFTLGVLHRPTRARRAATFAATVVLVALRVYGITLDLRHFRPALASSPHPAVVVLVGISVLLQVLVIVVAIESLRRLPQGVAVAD